MWRRTIDCLGRSVEIASPLAELEAPLTAVFRTYAEATAPADVTYVLEQRAWPSLVRDDVLVGRHDTARDLVPALELDLYAWLTAHAPGLLLHAAAVVDAHGQALVFAGRSGAGKSTLLRALLARGWGYVTEECVALFPGGRCRGLARALHLEDAAIAALPGFQCDPYVLRQAGGDRHTRVLHPPAHQVWRADAHAVAVIAIDHAPHAPDTLEPLGGGAALTALWPTVFRADPDALADAAAALADVARYRLHTTRPERALALALALAEELRLAPR